MHDHINCLLASLFVLCIAVIGNRFTTSGMHWYHTIKKPSWTPSGRMIGLVWTTIFVLFALSAIIVLNSTTFTATTALNAHPSHDERTWLIALFGLNGFLNVFWSYAFFYRHQLYTAAYEAAVLDLSVIALMIVVWPISRTASLFLLPYALWVAFASYLANRVAWMNR